MIKELKFVQGAVAKDDNVPALTHFHIHNGTIKGFNGTLQLCSPIAIEINICPNAKQFVKAIATCEEAISLQLNENNKLVVQSKNFKCFVDCVDEKKFPNIVPDGEIVQLSENFLNAVKTIEPFIIENTTRPWANGMLMHEESVFATDNIALAQHWVGCKFPFAINVPHLAIKELVRINENPVYMKITERHATFEYGNGKYLTTSLRADTWPNLVKILSVPNSALPVPENFFETLDKIIPFVGIRGEVYFFGNKITTSKDYEKEGTVIELKGLPTKGCFNAKSLRLLKGIIKTIDLAAYPKTCLFFGNNLRGAIMGLHYHD